ncbi:hypothetical protein JB92DRAFT_1671756 [Gautieria morchelliformis]|nr:hypothetical protein JB92DRAFT_1671756 [Gautieria morchelliformis]
MSFWGGLWWMGGRVCMSSGWWGSAAMEMVARATTGAGWEMLLKVWAKDGRDGGEWEADVLVRVDMTVRNKKRSGDPIGGFCVRAADTRRNDGGRFRARLSAFTTMHVAWGASCYGATSRQLPSFAQPNIASHTTSPDRLTLPVSPGLETSHFLERTCPIRSCQGTCLDMRTRRAGLLSPFISTPAASLSTNHRRRCQGSTSNTSCIFTAIFIIPCTPTLEPPACLWHNGSRPPAGMGVHYVPFIFAMWTSQCDMSDVD